jgi:heavy metal translocating P-type ATPase
MSVSGYEEVRVDELKAGDRILVLAGECLPVDGQVQAGSSTLNCSLLTGEARLEVAQPNTLVFAGTLNLQAPLEIEVQACGSASRLGQILCAMEEHRARKAPIVAFTDQISKAFVLVSLALVSIAFAAGYQSGLSEAISRALAMAIVVCPCAFAFATPLAFSVVMGRCAKNGILIKGADVIEKLAHIDQVVLDKTGTLTRGEFKVLNWIVDADVIGIEEAVFALEARSSHPIAKAVTRFLAPRVEKECPAEVQGYSEQIGRGVSGTIRGHRYLICSLSDSTALAGTHVAIYRDEKRVGRIILGDTLRSDSIHAVQALRARRLGVRILSGDCKAAVQDIARQLGVSRDAAISEASPERKSELIQKWPHAVMVGDGANDAVALASAYVGVAVHSSLEASMRAADVYQNVPGVMPVVRLIEISRETMKVIYRGFAFSLVYNVVGTIAAITGHVSPLFAAILMPISALTVFGSSILGTRRLRKTCRQLSQDEEMIL